MDKSFNLKVQTDEASLSGTNGIFTIEPLYSLLPWDIICMESPTFWVKQNIGNSKKIDSIISFINRNEN